MPDIHADYQYYVLKVPLLPSIPINHHTKQFLSMAPSICTELMNASWTTLVCPLKNVSYELVLTSLAVSCISYWDWFARWEVSGHKTGASRISSKQLTVSLCSSNLAFSPGISLESKWCNHMVVLTKLQLGIIPFILIRDQISMITNLPIAVHTFKCIC